MTDMPEEYNKIFMQRCLDLAVNGMPEAFPNPLVGCVITLDDRIIGEGYHRKFGGPHAEVNAIKSVQNQDLLKEASLYVNLEPCCHFGKTPPCCDLIISKGIKKVIIAGKDPNPLVAGKGIKKLMDAGIEVISEILEQDAIRLNKRFYCFHQKKRPYIILKWAQTSSGFIADPEGNSKWISNETSRKIVHKWRSEEMAIMVGTNTVLIDNPLLTTRDWPGKNPVRIIPDRKLALPELSNIYQQDIPTLVFNELKDRMDGKTEFCRIDFDEDVLKHILQKLFERNIQSLIVEGGSRLLKSFIDKDLWDETRIFVSSKTFKNGIPAPVIHGHPIEEYSIMDDKLLVYNNL